MADHVLLNQARGYALRIVIPHLIQRQIRGNQSGALPQVPLVQAEKQLRIDKAVVHLRPQIIDDQKIALQNIRVGILRCIRALEGRVRQRFKQPSRWKIDHGKALTDQRVRDAV